MFKILYIYSGNVDPYRDKRFIEEFSQFPDVELILWNNRTALVTQQSGSSRLAADAAITMYSKKWMGELLETNNIRSFNSVKASFTANNKWATYQKLRQANIPQPKTSLTPDFEFPYICKATFGSLGNNIKLVTSKDEASPVAVPHIFQEYIAESAGKSTRVIMVNKKPVAWYSLVNTKSFKSNFSKGGVGHTCTLTPEMEDLCIRTAECLNLDYCGIDLLYSNRGWLVLEVNSKPGLKGIETFTGINVAKFFAEHVVNTLRAEKALEVTND